MNILILSWRGPKHPLSGGAEFSTHEHAKAWATAGHFVTLFTSGFEGGKKEEYLDGIHIIRKGSYIFGVHVQALFWYLFSSHERFDLVIDQFHGIPFFTPLYVRTKKLGFIHEVAKEVWWLNPWPKPFNLIPAIIGNVFEPLIFKLFYQNIPFMTVSNSTKQDLIAWGIPSNKVTVIHNGVNFVFTQANKEKRKTILFLGALAKDKGIEDALEIFAILGKQNKSFQFWVVGWGSSDYLVDLKGRCKRMGIEKRVKFWGYVDEKKKFDLLSRADILLNPSVREGWGLVNIEANAVGTPVVGYNVPGIKDSVVNGKTGMLAKFGDKLKLVEDIVDLCTNSNLYNAISTNAVKWSKRFTWKKATKESLNLIEGL